MGGRKQLGVLARVSSTQGKLGRKRECHAKNTPAHVLSRSKTVSIQRGRGGLSETVRAEEGVFPAGCVAPTLDPSWSELTGLCRGGRGNDTSQITTWYRRKKQRNTKFQTSSSQTTLCCPTIRCSRASEAARSVGVILSSNSFLPRHSSPSDSQRTKSLE